MTNRILALFVAVTVVTACSKNVATPVVQRPAQKPPAAAGGVAGEKGIPAPKAVPAPAPKKIVIDPSNALIGTFQSDCVESKTGYTVKTDNVSNLYNSYRSIISIDASIMQEQFVWYKGTKCDVTNNKSPKDATALMYGFDWAYSVQVQGDGEGQEWQITYESVDGTPLGTTDSVTLKNEYDTEDQITGTTLHFKSSKSDDFVYHRQPE